MPCISLRSGKSHNYKINKIKITSDDNTPSSVDVMKLLPPETLNKIIESKTTAKPVPAPRISLEIQPRGTTLEDVTPRKPAIPEKPTTLPRPLSCTMKSLKIPIMPDIKSDVGSAQCLILVSCFETIGINMLKFYRLTRIKVRRWRKLIYILLINSKFLSLILLLVQRTS